MLLHCACAVATAE